MKGFVFGSSGFDQEEAEVFFDPGSGEGLFEDDGLEDLQAWEIIFAVDVVDVFFAGFDFGRAIEARVEQGQEGEYDAGETNQAGAHAQIIFAAAKDVAAQKFSADGAFYGDEEDDDNYGRTDVGEQVTGKTAEKVSGLVKELADGFISSGADEHNAEPSEERNEAAGHSFFSADVNAGAENDDE